MTEISNQIAILADLYANYKDDKGFRDFVEFNDLGLPLAYFANEGLATPSEDALRYISETFELFVGSLGIEDTGFTTLDEMLNYLD
jgi:pyridoxal biosynthesis lyase PdxS